MLKTFEEDIYGRKIIAENLTKIMGSQEESLVMSIDSEWGTGKTTFITMWKDLLDTSPEYIEKYKTLYFNAWDNDYINEPLLALFTEMQLQINEEGGTLKQSFEKVKSKLKPIAKIAVTSIAKMLTAGILDIEKIELGKFNEEEIIELAGKFGEMSVKEIAAFKTIRADFKEALSEYQKESGKKIVFFIDELDRCRPTFAIELLEVIKHLFNIDNCIFVISIDKEQLSHSVSTIYGQGMDTIGYLRRFFDLDYRLPRIDTKKYIQTKNSIILNNCTNKELFEFFIQELFTQEDFSLRDIDKAYYYIKLLIPLIKEFNVEEKNINVYIVTISYLYAVLITLKIKKQHIYNELLVSNYVVEEMLSNIPQIDEIQGENHIGGWHPVPLMEVISEVTEKYLRINLKYNKMSNATFTDESEYMVGLKEKDESYQYGYKFDLTKLLIYSELNIINKLEFIDNFSSQQS